MTDKHSQTEKFHFDSMLEILPSVLSADFSRLGDEVRRAEDAGADGVHVDIMDGHFVPNLTMGPQIVQAINRSTDLFIDVHLMIYNPFQMIERFVEAGADRITIHFEATEDVEEILAYIRKCNVQVGLAFSPETPESMMIRYLHLCDLLLLMTVHPGFGGQKFLTEVVDKITFARSICHSLDASRSQGGKTTAKTPLAIQVDGGINSETAIACARAGATSFVSGSFLFGCEDMRASLQAMRHALDSELKSYAMK